MSPPPLISAGVLVRAGVIELVPLSIDTAWTDDDPAGYIATSRNDWLRVFQYRGADGAWEGMFVPNGSGSVEWRLGWRIRIPADAFLLVTSLDESPGITVPTGVPFRLQAKGGARQLTVDRLQLGAVGGDVRWESPDYASSRHRIDIEFRGGAADLSILPE